MSIVEKIKKIEFVYEDQGGIIGKTEVEVDTDEGIVKYKNVKHEGGWSAISISFIVEVVDFLRKKGIVSVNETRPIVPPAVATVASTSSLQPPKVEGNGESSVSVPIESNIKPLTSLDFEESEEKSEDVISAPSIKVGEKETENEEVIIRPVIRTRTKDGDPLSAEKEGAALRKKNTEKSVKRKEE